MWVQRFRNKHERWALSDTVIFKYYVFIKNRHHIYSMAIAHTTPIQSKLILQNVVHICFNKFEKVGAHAAALHKSSYIRWHACDHSLFWDNTCLQQRRERNIITCIKAETEYYHTKETYNTSIFKILIDDHRIVEHLKVSGPPPLRNNSIS